MARPLLLFLAAACAACGSHPPSSASTSCQLSSQCSGGKICVDGTCVVPQQCSAFTPCPAGEYCNASGVCAGGNSLYLTFQTQPPATVYEGSTIAGVQVAAFDANHAPLSSGTVTLSGSALGAGSVSAQVASGVASFTNLAVTTPIHNATLTATMAGALSATSAPFDVTSWIRTTVSGGTVVAVALDPAHPGVAYATAAQMYRSTDGAASWSPLTSQPLTIFGGGNPARNYFFHAGAVYGGVGGGYSSSSDGGATWGPVISPQGSASAPPCASLNWIGSTFFALCNNALYASADGGSTFTLLTGGTGQPAQLGIVAASSTALYGLAPGSAASPLWIYSVGSWRQISNSQSFYALAAVSGATQAQDTVYGLGAAGLVSVLGGTQPANTGWIAPTGYGPSAGLVPDAASATTYYAIDSSGPVLKTTNSGGSWTKIYTWPSAPVYNRPCDGSPIGAANGQTVLIGCSVGAILRSSDGGTTFTFGMPGIHSLIGGSVVFYHPRQGGLAYALVGYEGVFMSSDSGVSWTGQSLIPALDSLLPDPKSASNLFGLAGGDLLQSTDSGKTFTLALSGGNTSTTGSVTDVAYAPPPSCGVSGTYVVAAAKGIFTGAGAVGTTPATLPPLASQTYPNALTTDPRSPGTLFAVLNDSSLLKSIDCGSTWTLVGNPTNFFLGAIAVDPTNGLNLLSASSDVLRSTNGGATFASAYHGGGTILQYAVAFAPGASSAISVGRDAVVRTDDGGATWTTIGAGLGQYGFSARTVSFDTAAPSRVLISTDDGVYLSTTGGK